MGVYLMCHVFWIDMYSLPDFLRGLSDFFGFVTPWASFDSSLKKNEKKKSQLKKTKTSWMKIDFICALTKQ